MVEEGEVFGEAGEGEMVTEGLVFGKLGSEEVVKERRVKRRRVRRW